MTIHNVIDALVDWAEEHVCKGMLFKVPDDDNSSDPEGLLTEPHAFPLYVPAAERLPREIKAPVPSVCVQFQSGRDAPGERRRVLNMRFSLAVWNPGQHGAEMRFPADDPFAELGRRYTGPRDPEELQAYRRSLDGWGDIFSFLDHTVEALENAEFLDGIRLVKEDGVTYGVYQEDGDFYATYPYWWMWVDFSVELGNEPRHDAYSDML